MPPPIDPFASSPPKVLSPKRRLDDHPGGLPNLTINSVSPSRADELPKRLKTSHPHTHSSGNAATYSSTATAVPRSQKPDMSKTLGVFSRPDPIDLTKKSTPLGFQPHLGVRKLVIKNLRASDLAEAERFYERTWKELDTAVTEIFDKGSVNASIEALCRGCEVTCRRGDAGKLAKHLEGRCKTYLEKELLPRILEEVAKGDHDTDALKVVHKHWDVWNAQSVSSHAQMLLDIC